jgi:hypothetical protein
MKKIFYVGVIIGGIFGIVIALSMDLVLGNTLGGGWSDAVAHDLNRLFKTNLSSDNILVIIGVVLSISIIGLIGAFIGGIFSIMIARIFVILTKER